MRSWVFLLVALVVAAAVLALALVARNDYLLFAGFVVLQYIVLATAWNILGGYCGYVNFGTAGFFGIGAYSTVALHKLGADPARYLAGTPFEALALLLPLPMPAMVLLGGVVSGLVGLGMGYLTLRLRGVFFAIATLAMAVVLQTIVVNWDFVGGSRGAYIIRPDRVGIGPLSLTYIEYLFALMLLLAAFALWVARLIERSRIGLGFATIRDDELAAEASGVPTLRLKLVATTLSGALMGMAGAPLPYYIGFVEPSAAFGLPYAVNSIAMPMIGGTTSWVGPLIGAILLGTLQQIATVTISSVVNLLIVGVLLVAFVIAAPVGIVGLVQEFLRAAAPSRINARSIVVIAVATYCFLAGILGVIFNLPAMQTANLGLAGIGAFGIAVGALYLTAAYGLLKRQGRAHRLTMLAFLAAIVLAATHAWLDRRGLTFHGVTIAAALAGLWLLQNRAVKELYDAPPPAAAPVPA
jgi:branched-chain amino acid transport system permease protein